MTLPVGEEVVDVVARALLARSTRLVEWFAVGSTGPVPHRAPSYPEWNPSREETYYHNYF